MPIIVYGNAAILHLMLLPSNWSGRGSRPKGMALVASSTSLGTMNYSSSTVALWNPCNACNDIFSYPRGFSVGTELRVKAILVGQLTC